MQAAAALTDELYNLFTPVEVLDRIFGNNKIPKHTHVCQSLCRRYGTPECACKRVPEFGLCASFYIDAVSAGDAEKKIAAYKARIGLH